MLSSVKTFALLLSALILFSCNPSLKTSHEQESKKAPLTRLLDGNQRFIENHPIHPDQSLAYIRSLKKGQHPFAVVVGCSDSRVPPELIFDQGFGDVFVIRTAGNVIGDYELGSIEYAVEHLHASLVVVLGHEECGAVSAYLQHKQDTVAGHVQHLIDYIKAEPEEQALDYSQPDILAKAIEANVLHGVHLLNDSEPIMKELTHSKKVQVVGAIYRLETGKVDLIQKD